MFSILYAEAFLDHRTGAYHPERPDRLRAIVKDLKSQPWADQLKWQLPSDRPELLNIITKVHPRDYVESVKRIASRGGGRIDMDTSISPSSYDVALLAVSAWLDAVDLVVHQGQPSFVLARPPGHHAERDRGMGFCIFSNAAIAARYALKQFTIDRVAVLDWDVHHGNGTQSILETHPQLAYCSLHEFPNYPGTGSANETGYYQNVLNIPLPPNTTSDQYRQVFQDNVIPFLSDFRPDLLIISAGYDGTKADTISQMLLQPDDYRQLTQWCLEITPHIMFGLEGGYDLESLSQSVVKTIEPFMTVNP